MEEKEIRSDKSGDLHEKRAWITPEIFDSPVVDVTLGTYSGQGTDLGTYS